jgi:hypothetical protein
MIRVIVGCLFASLIALEALRVDAAGFAERWKHAM